MSITLVSGIRRFLTALFGKWGFRQRSMPNETHSSCNRSNSPDLDPDSAFRMSGMAHARHVENILLVKALSHPRREWREILLKS